MTEGLASEFPELLLLSGAEELNCLEKGEC